MACPIDIACQPLEPSKRNEIPDEAIRTWRPTQLTFPAFPRYSFTKAALYKIVERIDIKIFEQLLFPDQCECRKCVSEVDEAFTAFLNEEANDINLVALKSLIMTQYLSSFVWLLACRIPWYILYLIHIQAYDTLNPRIEDSLGRFDIKEMQTHLQIDDDDTGEDSITVDSSVCGLSFSFNIPTDTWEHARSLLTQEKHEALEKSHPVYFLRDILIPSDQVQHFESSSALPILGNYLTIRAPKRLSGEGGVYAIDIQDYQSMPSDMIQPGISLFKSYPFAIKVFKPRDPEALGLRELIAFKRALKLYPQGGSPSILFPITSFFYGDRLCIVYPRAVCDFYAFMTGEYRKSPYEATRDQRKAISPPEIKLSGVKLWHQLAKVADTLEYLHQRNCYHLDLKSSNLLVMANGDLMLSDFGEMGSPKAELAGFERFLSADDIKHTRPGILEKHYLGDPVAAPPDAATKMSRAVGQEEHCIHEFFKSYDLFTFGRICFEAAIYDTKLKGIHKLWYDIREEYDDLIDRSIHPGALFRIETAGEERFVVMKDTVVNLLEKIALKSFIPSRVHKSYSRVSSSQGVNYTLLSSIIRRLLNIESMERVQGPKPLNAQLLSCLPGNSVSPFSCFNDKPIISNESLASSREYSEKTQIFTEQHPPRRSFSTWVTEKIIQKLKNSRLFQWWRLSVTKITGWKTTTVHPVLDKATSR